MKKSKFIVLLVLIIGILYFSNISYISADSDFRICSKDFKAESGGFHHKLYKCKEDGTPSGDIYFCTQWQYAAPIYKFYNANGTSINNEAPDSGCENPLSKYENRASGAIYNISEECQYGVATLMDYYKNQSNPEVSDFISTSKAITTFIRRVCGVGGTSTDDDKNVYRDDYYDEKSGN